MYGYRTIEYREPLEGAWAAVSELTRTKIEAISGRELVELAVVK